jgi:hypothetical protein
MAIDKNLYKADGMHVLRQWLLTKINTDLEMLRKTEDGYPITPFIPSQQMPELNNVATGHPYIVYTYSTTSDYPESWCKIESAVIRIYGDKEEQLRILKSYIFDLLDRDEVPEILTDYANTLSTSLMRIFDFKTMQVINAIGPEPYDQEGGRQLAAITVRYEYTTAIDQYSRMRMSE